MTTSSPTGALTACGTASAATRQVATGLCRRLHRRRSQPDATVAPWFELDDDCGREPEGAPERSGGVFVTSLHGLSEEDGSRRACSLGAGRRRIERFVAGADSFRLESHRQIDRQADRQADRRADHAVPAAHAALVGLMERGRR